MVVMVDIIKYVLFMWLVNEIDQKEGLDKKYEDKSYNESYSRMILRN